MRKNAWSKEEDQILIEKLPTISKLPEILSFLPKRSYHSVINRMVLLGIKKRNFYKDEDFFSVPNPINSSLAGYISSDGHLSPRSVGDKRRTAGVSFNILEKDKQILEDFVELTKLSTKIKYRAVKQHIKFEHATNEYNVLTPYAILRIPKAEKWHEDLWKNWKIPAGKKSLIMTPPNLTNLDDCLAYIVGLINGDGSILCKRDSKYENSHLISINLLGTKELLDWCKTILETAIQSRIEASVRYQSRNHISEFRVSGLNAIKIFEVLNKLNVLKLKRKWENPEILSRIEKYKSKFPHLFISQSPTQSVIAAD